MPMLSLSTNITLEPEAAQTLLRDVSAHVAQLLGKPESYVMVRLQPGLMMSFAGDDTPCAFAELDSLGLPEQRTADFSAQLCEFIGQRTGIAHDRIYIRFSSPQRHMWGWQGRTF
jgi:phenylpyruvate tautomerase PptA (4-oxalocrotonate tautomerase family)